jgi:hypothetical protein
MNEKEMPAPNKRFGEIGGEVTVRILVHPLTVSDSPNSVQSSPNFVKPPGRYLQADESAAESDILRKKYKPKTQ